METNKKILGKINTQSNLASQGLYTSARATAKTLVDTGHVTTQILGGI
jgi:hypothetical protein